MTSSGHMVRGGAPAVIIPIEIENSIMVQTRLLGMSFSGMAVNIIGNRLKTEMKVRQVT